MTNAYTLTIEPRLPGAAPSTHTLSGPARWIARTVAAKLRAIADARGVSPFAVDYELREVTA